MRVGAAAVLATALVFWPCGRAPAQVTGPVADTLAAAEAALDSGEVDRARELLRGWRPADGAPRSERSRVRFLRARLASDADSAESLYLEIAMEGDARYGDRAWLRLAQLHLSRGEAERARSELERLRSDYPGSSLVAESWYWTGLAFSTAGDRQEACSAWRRAADAGAEAAELAGEALHACRPGGPEMPVAGPPEGETRGAAAGDAPARGDAAEGDAGGGSRGRYAAQLGAFRERGGARALAERAREAGFEVRIVGPSPGDGLLRVRTAGVASRAEAETLVRRLRDRGLPGMVVDTRESENSDGEGDR